MGIFISSNNSYMASSIDWNTRSLNTTIINPLGTGIPAYGEVRTIVSGSVGRTGIAVGLLDNNGQFIIAPELVTSSPGFGTLGTYQGRSTFNIPVAGPGPTQSYGLKIESNTCASGTSPIHYFSGVGKGHWVPTMTGYLNNEQIYITRGASVPYVDVTLTGSNYIIASGAALAYGYYGSGVMGDLVYCEEGPNSGSVFRITGTGIGVSVYDGSKYFLEGYSGGGITSGQKISIWLSRTITGEGNNFYHFGQKLNTAITYPSNISLNNSTIHIASGSLYTMTGIDNLLQYKISGNLLTGLDQVSYSGRIRAGDYITYFSSGAGENLQAMIAAHTHVSGQDYIYIATGYNNTGVIDTFTGSRILRSNDYFVLKGPVPGKTYTAIAYSGFKPYNATTIIPSSPFTGVAARESSFSPLVMNKIDTQDINLEVSFNEYDSNVTSIGSRAHFHLGPLYYGNEVILSGISGIRATLISPQSTGFNTIKYWDMPAHYPINTKDSSAQDGSYYDPYRGIFVLTYNAGIQFDQARTYTMDVSLVVNNQTIRRVIPVPTQPPI